MDLKLVDVDAAAAVYRDNLKAFDRIAQHVRDNLEDKCNPDVVHKIEFRAKGLESFKAKASKTEEGVSKYRDPINEITDLAGVRVIVFTKSSVDPVCRIIEDLYNVIEREDVGERVYRDGRFGYQSVHMLVEVDKKQYLGKSEDISKVVCEIQVRTVMQHAWAELEHDIQYKGGEVPIDIAKRFSALAGLLEIADNELESIHAANAELRDAVHSKLLNDLTQESLTSRNLSSDTGEFDPEGYDTVRELITDQRYEDAIKWYDNKLEREPKAYTALIGRAKLKFLLGHASSALKDLTGAAVINPNDRAIEKIRQLIESGNIESLKLPTTDNFDAQTIESGFSAIEAGEGLKAFEIWEKLQSEGYNTALALFAKSMACAVEGDTKGAREFLTGFKIIPTTPMSVNICALHYVLDRMDGGSADAALENLKRMLAFYPQFTIKASRLKHLLKGLLNRSPDAAGRVTAELMLIGLLD